MRAVLLLPLLLFAIGAPPRVKATGFGWSRNAISGDWADPNNWGPMFVPNGPDDSTEFRVSGISAIALPTSGPIELSDMFFPFRAPPDDPTNPFSFFIEASSSLLLSGFGIHNDSPIYDETFNVHAGEFGAGGITFSNFAGAGTRTKFFVFGSHTNHSGGRVGFQNFSTADHGVFQFTGGGTPGGAARVDFYDNAHAGSADFLFGGGNGTDAEGGLAVFWGNANAERATFRLDGGQYAGELGAAAVFQGNSSAGSATMTANGATNSMASGAHIEFRNFSTAAESTLIANAGLNGGEGAKIIFVNRFSNITTGGTARIQLSGNSTLDLQEHYPDLTVGSIEGSGGILVGGNTTLIVGSNNLSTTFSGVIQLFCNCVGIASLTKIGTGALTLSGPNTYTGPTIVSGGKLIVDGTLSSSVTVKAGAAVGGSGSLNSLTVEGGGSVAPGSSPGRLTIFGNYTQNSGGIFEAELGGYASGTEHDQLAITASAMVAGLLRVSLTNGFKPNLGDQFTVLTASSSISGNFSSLQSDDITVRCDKTAAGLTLAVIDLQPLRVVQTARTGSAIALNFRAIAQRTYRLERRFGLTTDSWQQVSGVSDFTASTSGTAQVVDSNNGNQSQAFYRVRLLP